MVLFKVISTHDEVTMGFAQEANVEKLAARLAKEGHLEGWLYATARGEKGDLVMKPQREVAILAAQVLRIEPVVPGQPVVVPPAR